MLFVGMPWLLHNLFTTLFDKKELKAYLFQLFKYVISAFVIASLSYLLCNIIPLKGILLLVVRIIICGCVTIIVFFIVYRKTDEFKRGIMLLDGVTRGKLHLRQLVLKK